MKKRYLASFILLLFTGLLMLLVSRFPGVFFPACRNFSKALLSAIAAVTSVFSVAVWDIACILLIFALAASLIFVLVRKKSFFSWLSYVVLIVSVGLAEVFCGWMLNHYAPALSEEIGLDVEEYSVEELYETTAYLLERAEEASNGIPRNASGAAIRQDFGELAEIAGKSYTALVGQYDIFRGCDKPVKKLSLFGNKLLRDGFTGIFMPLTAESSVPENDPPVPICFFMCHEAAHRLGIAAEEEANFCAFLACTASSDKRFVYSGWYMAFGYCFNALYSENPELAMTLYDASYNVFRDRRDTSEIYSEYEGPAQEVHEKINDTYLKAMGEESGVKSYGEVADYLIAWALQEQWIK